MPLRGAHHHWDGVVFDTRALGIRPGTPLLGLSVFDAPPGRRSPASAEEHGLLIVSEDGPVRLRRRLRAGHADHDLGPGDIFLLPAGEEAGLEWAAPLRGVGVWIDGPSVPDFARVEVGLAVDGIAFAEEAVLHDPEIVAAALALREAVTPEGPGRRLIFDSLSRVLLTKLLRKYGRLSDPAGAAFGTDRMRLLRAHVAAHLRGTPHVTGMSAAVGMSASAFGRALRHATGLTPMAFVREMRIERAKELLLGTGSLGEIAARCGFADQSHFTRSFKAATGRTPRTWRLARRGGVREDAA